MPAGRLPGVGTAVLSERLRQLERHGLVSRRRLSPPAPAQVYELTTRGAALDSVFTGLAQWGAVYIAGRGPHQARALAAPGHGRHRQDATTGTRDHEFLSPWPPQEAATVPACLNANEKELLIGILGRLQAHLLAQALEAEDVINE